jgi:hypothetical protein
MSFSEKIYRFLLRAYPRGYRARYGGPMEQLFRDRLRETHGPVDFIRFWLRTLADWAVSVPRHYGERTAPRATFGALAVPTRRCIFFARSEASSFSRHEITVEHLLLGLLREEPALVTKGALDTVVSTLEANEPATRRVPPMEDLRIGSQAIRVLEAAREIAETAGRREVSPVDLAAGILRESGTLAARLLREHASDRH